MGKLFIGEGVEVYPGQDLSQWIGGLMAFWEHFMDLFFGEDW